MKSNKNPDDQAAQQSDAAPEPETVDQRQDTLQSCDSTLNADEISPAEFADCVSLIDQVRDNNPEYISDLLDGTVVPEDAASTAPKKIGRFQIRQQVGSGSYGLVYRAVDPELGRDVALKIPRVGTMLRETDRERFLREAQTLSVLSHPNIATVYEAGHAGPICFIVSAFYQGGSLAQHLARHGPLSCRPAAALVCRLADAIEHAHQRGILHRDIKPDNVLFDADEPVTGPDTLDPSTARIADFGLAGFVDQDPELTRTGALIGTPSYMSPEQADGRHVDISTASDVYALGAILYELLTGRPPHEKESLLASLEAIRSEEPIAPSHRASQVPRDLEAICLRCLEKTPDRRYTRAAALADDLQCWMDGKPVTARPLTALRRTMRWCR